jgi:FAD dependent oxidoreductase TIGR03364
MPPPDDLDILIIGAGIVGLAHALAAVRHGLKVAVLDRDARAVGASVRNFGFVTVTGQEAGITWRRARRSRDVWAEVATPAGITLHQRGLLVCARRAEALACLEQFAATAMGAQCRLLTATEAADQPGLRRDLVGALHSPHELRVESRHAIGQLTTWLAAQGVAFLTRIAATAVETGTVVTPAGRLRARHIVVCPGTDLVTLFPEVIARRRTTLCKLHMLRLASPGVRLPAPVMSDLGLTRYLGYAGCAALPALRARLAAEQPAHLADGIHLIAVQDRDGSMVVGDSHHYGDAPDPFQPRAVDDRMLEELSATLDIPAPDVIERWVGVYPSGPDVCFAETPEERVHLVMVTSGTGASTSFALAEETLARILDAPPPPHTDADWTPP